MTFKHVLYHEYYRTLKDFGAPDDPMNPDGAYHIVNGGYMRLNSGKISVLFVVH